MAVMEGWGRRDWRWETRQGEVRAVVSVTSLGLGWPEEEGEPREDRSVSQLWPLHFLLQPPLEMEHPSFSDHAREPGQPSAFQYLLDILSASSF